MVKLTYISILTLLCCLFFMNSCDRDSKETNAHSKNMEGYWLYVDTKVDIVLSDTFLIKDVRNYISRNYSIQRASYEFKNNKTFYLYQNYSEEPLRGNYERVDKEYFVLDDARGFHRVVYMDSLIYVMTNLKRDIAQGLNVDENRIVKADLMEIFKRGLPSNK